MMVRMQLESSHRAPVFAAAAGQPHNTRYLGKL